MADFDFNSYNAANSQLLPDDPAKGGGQSFDFQGYAARGGKGESLGGAAQAFGEHAGNQLAMGYLPHLQAATQPGFDETVDLLTGNDTTGTSKLHKAISALTFALPPVIAGKLIKEAFLPDKEYIAQRDENIKRLAQEKEDYPISATAGDVAGIVGGAVATAGVGPSMARAPVGAGMLARGLVAGKNIGAAAARGAVQAGLWNPGDTEGQAGGLQLDQRLHNAKVGAEIGGAVQGAFEAAPLIKGAVQSAGAKIASTLSGEPEGIVANYAKNTDKINQMIKQSGGDVSQMADSVREKLQNSIRTYRQGLGNQIGKALESASQEASIPNQPILDALAEAREGLNPVYKQEAIDQINGIIEKIKAGSTQASEGARGGMMSPAMLNEAKEFLQEQAKSAYMKGGQIFQNAPEVAQASRSAAAVARKALNQAVPEVAQANNQLAALHLIEDRLNPNLIKPGGPDGALLAAGAGMNPRNARNLQMLEKITGIPARQEATDLATAKAFANPGLLPADHTGKAMARMALLGGLGHVAAPGVGIALGALASPAAVKAAINVGNAAGKVAAGFPAMAAGTSNAVASATNAIGSNVRQGGLKAPLKDESDDPQIQQFFRNNPALLENIQDQQLRQKISTKMSQDRAPSQQLKGEALWVQNGVQALKQHGANVSDAQVQQLSATPRGKALLIQASDLKPGSKAMQNVYQQIQGVLRGSK